MRERRYDSSQPPVSQSFAFIVDEYIRVLSRGFKLFSVRPMAGYPVVQQVAEFIVK